jgi:hypothetical protein
MKTDSPEFNFLLEELSYSRNAGPDHYEALRKRIHATLQAIIVNERLHAVDQFKAICKFQDQVMVNEKALDEISAKMEALASNHADGLFDADVKWLAEGLTKLKNDGLDSNLKVPDDTTPEFTIEADEDLDRLLNSTAALLSGHANMDVGIAWSEDLEKVLARLATAGAADIEEEGQTGNYFDNEIKPARTKAVRPMTADEVDEHLWDIVQVFVPTNVEFEREVVLKELFTEESDQEDMLAQIIDEFGMSFDDNIFNLTYEQLVQHLFQEQK